MQVSSGLFYPLFIKMNTDLYTRKKMTTITWFGIIFCITQSAMFSGLNLAFFSISKLQLEIGTKKHNKKAIKVAKLRKDSNFLLTTILWGNVCINVLLTLLSNSVMAGVMAFIFSTVVITFFGEIIPQAYFSRYALKTASLLAPVLRFYQIILYPVAKPTALALDKLLGKEAILFFKETELRELFKIHIKSKESDIADVEGRGALNFLAIDDIPVIKEGEIIDPASILAIPFKDGIPLFPEIKSSTKDPFLKLLKDSNKKWVIITDDNNNPKLIMNANKTILAALFDEQNFNPRNYCHKPIVVTDKTTTLENVIPALKVQPECLGDDVIDKDTIIFWGEEKRIITGSDILGRLMRGIVQNKTTANLPVCKNNK